MDDPVDTGVDTMVADTLESDPEAPDVPMDIGDDDGGLDVEDVVGVDFMDEAEIIDDALTDPDGFDLCACPPGYFDLTQEILGCIEPYGASQVYIECGLSGDIYAYIPDVGGLVLKEEDVRPDGQHTLTGEDDCYSYRLHTEWMGCDAFTAAWSETQEHTWCYDCTDSFVLAGSRR